MSTRNKNWQEIVLGDECIIERGISWQRDQEENSSKKNVWPVLTIPNIKSRIDLTNLKYINGISQHDLKRSMATIGYTIMIGSNGNRTRVGDCCYIDKDLKALYASFLIGLVPKQNTKLKSRFLYYLLKTPVFRNRIQGSLIGTTSLSNLRLSFLRELKFIVPSKNDQNKIVTILEAYDRLIENNSRRIKILEEMAQNLYREWFVNFRFPGYEKTKMIETPQRVIPEGWEIINILNLAEVTYGFGFNSMEFNSDGLGIPIVRIRDIPMGISNTYTTEKANDKYHVNNGDLLVGMDGDFHIGFWVGGKSYLVQRVARFRSLGEICNFHLYFALKEPIQYFNATISGTTVSHLGDRHIRTINVIWPSLKLRIQTNSIFDTILKQIINLRLRNQILNQSRDLILPKIISGELDVSEIDIDNEVNK